jgi:proteasome lid subunit RPN8/RPN11
MKLTFPARMEARIKAHAAAEFPRECCGLLEGRRGGGGIEILNLHPARNLAARPDRFEIHPEDHFAALKGARGRGHAIIGCYHSHPGGAAKPSSVDLARAGEEDFLWLIAALADAGAPPSLAGFVYAMGGFQAVTLAAPNRPRV